MGPRVSLVLVEDPSKDTSEAEDDIGRIRHEKALLQIQLDAANERIQGLKADLRGTRDRLHIMTEAKEYWRRLHMATLVRNP